MMKGETHDGRILVNGHRVPTWTLSHVGNDATPQWAYGQFRCIPRFPGEESDADVWLVQRVRDGRADTYRDGGHPLSAAKAIIEDLWMSWAEDDDARAPEARPFLSPDEVDALFADRPNWARYSDNAGAGWAFHVRAASKFVESRLRLPTAWTSRERALAEILLIERENLKALVFAIEQLASDAARKNT